MDGREKLICSIKDGVITYKRLEIWDILFCAVMVVTMLAVRAYRIREIIQLLFILVSFRKLKLNHKYLIEILFSRYLFLAWCFCTFFGAMYPNVVIGYLPSVIQSTLLLCSVVIYFSQRRTWHLYFGIQLFLILTFILVAYLFLTVPIADLIQGKIKLESRISVRGINANQVGVCCSYSILILIENVIGMKKSSRILLGVPMLMTALLTGSKKAFLTVILGVVLLTFVKAENKKKIIQYLILTVLAVGILVWAVYYFEFLYVTIGKRLDGLLGYLLEGNGDKSTNSRGVMIRHAFKLFLEHPLGGIGLHNFKQVNVYEVYAHNNYVELLACTGFPGFLFYYTAVIKQLYWGIQSFSKKRSAMRFVLVLMCCFLVNEYATISYTNEVIQLILGLILGFRFLEEV